MIEIVAIDHVVLRVKDLARMQQFYCEVLGCVLERSEPDLGLYQLRAGSALIDLVPIESVLGRKAGAAPNDCPNVDHICLRVASFDAQKIHAYLSQHGIIAGEVTTRYGAEGFGPSIYLVDPEGNTLELKGSAHLLT